MLGNAKPIIDCTIAAGGKQPRRAAHGFSIDTGYRRKKFGTVAILCDKFGPVAEFFPIATLTDEGFVRQPLGDNDMGKRGEDRNIGAGPQRQMKIRAYMRRAHNIRAARVDHDQFGTLPEATFDPAGKDRMTIGRVRADDQDHVALLDTVEVLRARRCSEGGLETIARGRVAYARAGIDVVGAKACADQLLHKEGFFICAPARSDPAQSVRAVGVTYADQPGRGKLQRFLPVNFAPGLVDPLPDHRFEDTLLMLGIAPGETSFDAAMPAIGLAFLPGHHPHKLFAAHLRAKGAADPIAKK